MFYHPDDSFPLVVMNIEVVEHVDDVDLEAKPDDLCYELDDPENTMACFNC